MRALNIEDTNADVYSAILSQRKYFCLIIFYVNSLCFFFSCCNGKENTI